MSKPTRPEGISDLEWFAGVVACDRCHYETEMYLADVVYDDATDETTCRNRMVCDGHLIEHASGLLEMARYILVGGPDDLATAAQAYGYLTEAADLLGTLTPLETDGPLCANCGGPLPDGADDGATCRFCIVSVLKAEAREREGQ